jgi:hypothetical protein
MKLVSLCIRHWGLVALGAVVAAVPGFLPPVYGQAAPSAVGQTDASRSSRTAESTPAESKTRGAADKTLAVGRVIYATLAQTIDAKKAKAGEAICAKVSLAVLSHGEVLIADGAKVTGHVTEAIGYSKKDSQSSLGIVFDKAQLPDGTELPLALTVQAVGIGGLETKRSVHLDPETGNAGISGPPLMLGQGARPGRGAEDDLPEVLTQPALDMGSKGTVGLPGLDLTEGTDEKKGSLVTSTRKDVKLDNGDELVLRVIASKAAAPPK